MSRTALLDTQVFFVIGEEIIEILKVEVVALENLVGFRPLTYSLSELSILG